MSQPLGLAILGAGIFIAEAHLPAILAVPELLSIKAIYSRSSSSASTLLSHPSLDSQAQTISTYSGEQGLDDVLAREDVHAVIIALPIIKQAEVVLKCLKAGKHVLSEKPIAHDVKTAVATIKEYEKTYAPKGLLWRVAENWAHEPSTLFASSLLHPTSSSPSPLGPILSYDLRVINHVKPDHKYHATGWRNVPSHQGGFLLDGGVHYAAGLRVVLGEDAPTKLIAHSTLHRTHMPPHDTIVAIVSNPGQVSKPYGEGEVKVEEGSGLVLGKSYTTGTISITFASSNLPEPIPFSLTVHCLNGMLTFTNGSKGIVTLKSTDPAVQALLPSGSKEFPSSGVPEEVAQFARACLGRQEGESDKGTPRGAFWDLALLEASLTSEGQMVDLGELRSWREGKGPSATTIISSHHKTIPTTILRSQLLAAQSIKHLEQKPSSSSANPSGPVQPTTPSPTYHPALLAILTHLRKELTALSLAFSGPSVSIDAFVGQAEKVSSLVEQLVSCVIVLDEGSYLKQEWTGSVSGIVAGLQALLETFSAECRTNKVSDSGKKISSPPTASTSTSTTPPEPYLVQTSTLWSAIDLALSSTSSSELLAVTKILKADKECMDDGMREFKELLEEDEGLGAEEVDGDDFEGGGSVEEGSWAELERDLGAGQSRGLTEEERDRVKNLDMILRLSIGLHNRISQYILPLFPPPVSTEIYTTYLTRSHELSSDIDNVVSSLFAPQDADEVHEAAQETMKRSRGLCALCEEGLAGELEDGMQSLTVSKSEAEHSASRQRADRIAKERKWLGLWRVQLDKAWKKWETVVE